MAHSNTIVARSLLGKKLLTSIFSVKYPSIRFIEHSRLNESSLNVIFYFPDMKTIFLKNKLKSLEVSKCFVTFFNDSTYSYLTS